MFARPFNMLKTIFLGGLAISAPLVNANNGEMFHPYQDAQNNTGSFCPDIAYNPYYPSVYDSDPFFSGILPQIYYYVEPNENLTFQEKIQHVRDTAEIITAIYHEEPANAKHLQTIFNQDKFHVVVADDLDGGKQGFYSYEEQELVLTTPQKSNCHRTQSTARHEFHHAEKSLFSNPQHSLPYDTPAQKKLLLDAIQIGDKRVKQFGEKLQNIQGLDPAKKSECERLIKLFSSYQPRCKGDPFYGNNLLMQEKLQKNEIVRTPEGKIIQRILSTKYGMFALAAHANPSSSAKEKAVAFVRDMDERPRYLQAYQDSRKSFEDNVATMIKEGDAAIFEAPHAILQEFYPELLKYHVDLENKRKNSNTLMCKLQK